MPRRARTKAFRLPLLGAAPFRVVVGATLADAYALARRRSPTFAERDGGDEAGACVLVDGEPWILLDEHASPGTTAHEAWHAVAAILRDRGVAPDEELTAYCLQYVIDAITPWLSARK